MRQELRGELRVTRVVGEVEVAMVKKSGVRKSGQLRAVRKLPKLQKFTKLPVLHVILKMRVMMRRCSAGDVVARNVAIKVASGDRCK